MNYSNHNHYLSHALSVRLLMFEVKGSSIGRNWKNFNRALNDINFVVVKMRDSACDQLPHIDFTTILEATFGLESLKVRNRINLQKLCCFHFVDLMLSRHLSWF